MTTSRLSEKRHVTCGIIPVSHGIIKESFSFLQIVVAAVEEAFV